MKMIRSQVICLCMLLCFCACTACGTPQQTNGSSPETNREGSLQTLTSSLSSDGLLHDPYGWDNLYGSKEVPELWWQRMPRDPKAGELVKVNIAVSPDMKNKEVWLEWELNGQRMEPILCAHTANLSSDGVTRLCYSGSMGPFDVGDRVEYDVCAGEKETMQRAVGPFAFSVSQWQTVSISGLWKDTESSVSFQGQAGKIPVLLRAELLDDNTFSLCLERGELKTMEIMTGETSISRPTLKVSFSNTPCEFTMDNEGKRLLTLHDGGIEILTDGEKVSAVRLTIEADQTDRFYGFGMKYDSLNQRGKVVDTYCVNWYTQQQGETYTPVPYYFVPNTYGLFVDSTYYSRFSMCADKSDACVIEVNTGGKEAFSVPIYFLAGNNENIAASYARLAGKAELPPVWAFGPWISANEWNKQSEVMEQLAATQEWEIPTSVLVLEAWSDEETFYSFNDSRSVPNDGSKALTYEDFTFSGRWPDPKAMVDALHENNIRVLLWQIPVLKSSTSATVQSKRDQEFALEHGYVLKYENNAAYRLPSGTWFGNSLLMDFTNAEAVKWFLAKREYLLKDLGIDGFKTDGGEFVWGRNVLASDGRRGDELRNAYPDLYAQAYYDFANLYTDAITFSRSGGSGMQAHPLCWIGDQVSDQKAFQSAIRATLSASMSGIPYVAWDIAGFSGDVPSSELYQRSVAQAAFSAVMQIHSEASRDPVPSQARTPWNMIERKGNDDCLQTYRFFANVRMNLLPYIYSEAYHSSETGEPLMRSMAYQFPEDAQAGEYEYQYMLGRQILVAPVTNISSKRIEVYLPEGIWYGLFDGQRYEQGLYEMTCELDEIPVFVRAGSILPVHTDESGVLGSYVGNDTGQYQDLCFWVYSGDSMYQWFDYVSEKEIELKTSGGTFTAIGLPAAQEFEVKWMEDGRD